MNVYSLLALLCIVTYPFAVSAEDTSQDIAQPDPGITVEEPAPEPIITKFCESFLPDDIIDQNMSLVDKL